MLSLEENYAIKIKALYEQNIRVGVFTGGAPTKNKRSLCQLEKIHGWKMATFYLGLY